MLLPCAAKRHRASHGLVGGWCVAKGVTRPGISSADCRCGQDEGVVNGLTGGSVAVHHRFEELRVS